jgi:hypothetical protein
VVLKQGKIEMKETEEVRELRGKILGMEMELNIISKDLEKFEIQLFNNLKIKKEIDENIAFLKKDRVTVSLLEYKKIKHQKELVEMRIKYYNKKIQPLKNILSYKEDFHKKEIERFYEIYRMQFKNNILEFSSDRKKA